MTIKLNTKRFLFSICNNSGQSSPQGCKALVKLDTQYLESLNGDASQRKGLETGMQVAAEIHQGRRTIMEYLLSPVQKVSAEAAGAAPGDKT